MSTKTPDEVQVIEPPRTGKRRFYSAQEKLNFLHEAEAPGSSMSAVARRYGISPSQLFRWRRFRDEGTLTSLGAGEAVVPESELKALQAQVRELQRLLSKKMLENEILREAVEIARQQTTALALAVSRQGWFPMKSVADTMGVSRSNLVEPAKPRERKKRSPPADDACLLPRIRALTDGRPTYGYRRATAMLNRELLAEGKRPINHKRTYRIMREAKVLLARYTGKPTRTHDGQALVKTLRRDYVCLSHLDDAEKVMRLLPIWLDDYNELHPHKGLKMQSPREYRRTNSTAQPCPV